MTVGELCQWQGCEKEHEHPIKGLWYRQGSGDERVLVEVCGGSYTKFLDKLLSDDIVLDLGTHVGSFSHLALRHGVSAVISVEPDPTAVELITRNASKATLVRVAVVGEGRPKIAEFQVNRTSTWGNSLTYKREDEHVIFKVRTRSMLSLLKEFRPTIVKIDIEGGEFDALESLEWPSYVRGLTIEYHYEWCGYPDARERIERIHQDFLRQGFICEIKEVYGLAELATYWRKDV